MSGTKSSILAATLQKMENFLKVPAKSVSKETAALKQKETKLKVTLSKTKNVVTTLEKRVAVATKSKGSNSKKQVVKAKSALKKTLKTLTLLQKQLTETTMALASSVQTETQLTAVSKYLRQFEKEWKKQSKPTVKAKAKTKVKAKVKSKTKATKTTRQTSNVIELPKEVESYDSTVENESPDDIKEALNRIFN